MQYTLGKSAYVCTVIRFIKYYKCIMEYIITVFLKYVKSNPLELPAFILSIVTFFMARRKFKATFAKIILQRIFTTNGPYFELKISHPEKGQSLSITEIPSIYRKNKFYYKNMNLLVDYSRIIDQKTNEEIPDVYYISLKQFDKLLPGKYLIKTKVDRLPYKLKYKLELPISDSIAKLKSLK